MKPLDKSKQKILIFVAVILLLLIALPFFTQGIWLDMVVRIRQSINTGDGGLLILAAASYSMISAIQNTLTFILFGGMVYHCTPLKNYQKGLLLVLLYIGSSILESWIGLRSWEYATGILSAVIMAYLLDFQVSRRAFFMRLTLLSFMLFFAFQWLNILPMFQIYDFGNTDIPKSIQYTGQYLGSTPVLNFVGISMFVSIFLGTMITANLFIIYDRNLSVVKEGILKEKELDEARERIMQNRIYQEINELAHDLKTPLVTIRGLNSLVNLSTESDSAREYTGRIDSAVDKMSQMISSFLYDSSRQILTLDQLIQYIRAQLPLELENQVMTFSIQDKDSLVRVNKIRMVRALNNVIENAILAPAAKGYKEIVFSTKIQGDQALILVQDNGSGIPPEDMDKIWEMGFSTKQSSGLGLFFVKKVIQDNGGTVVIESQEGEGTRVTILLPLYREEYDGEE